MRRWLAARPAASLVFAVAFGWTVAVSALVHTDLPYDGAPICHDTGPRLTTSIPSNVPIFRPCSVELTDSVCLACAFGRISTVGLDADRGAARDDQVTPARPLAPPLVASCRAPGAIRLRAPPTA